MQEQRLLPAKPIESFEAYIAAGGGTGLAQALTMSPEQVIVAVNRSGLRGRGGAGFPTGMKWATVAHDPCPVKYFVCNAAEGEPGTFKDRMLMRMNPYQLLEGIAIGAYAISAREAYLVMKKSFEREHDALSLAMNEMAAQNRLGAIPIKIVEGPEDYLLGEEKALLEVIEGGLAMPREAQYPPYIKGLFITDPWQLNPAVVNNAETLSNIPQILAKDTDWFRSTGTTDSPGTMVFTVSGDVVRPGVFELALGTPLRELVFEHAGGLLPERKLKAIFSGVSNAVILPNSLDTLLAFDTMKAIGSGLGSAGFIVYDDTTCMVQLAHTFSRFLWIESCDQCSACKRGTDISTINLQKLIDGEGSEETIQSVVQGAVMAPQGNRCFLPVEHQQLILSMVAAFGEEFHAHLEHGCFGHRKVALPKMEDFDEARRVFTYSEGRTQP
jgi:NADH:ubiquinone oxidoreductase subunit F (NADH-binding)